MGLTNVTWETQKEAAVSSNVIPNRQKHNAQPLTASDGKAASGKGGLTAAQKGKGRGDIQQNEPKGRGKSRRGPDVKVQKHDVEQNAIKGKAKGKGKNKEHQRFIQY